jgi:potassium-transporting ATPase potassium-binding subunit
MPWLDWLQPILLVVLLVLLARPMGLYMAHVFEGEPTFADPVLKPVERLFYRVAGIDAGREMKWTAYAIAVLAFSAVGFLVLYATLRLQGLLPLNPRNIPGMSPDLAFNTAVSFVTNTNWQNYLGEQAASNLSQMAGLTIQNFLSAAVGISVAIAFVRGIVRKQRSEIGNFWVDVTRSTLYVLLPLSIVIGVFYASQGVVQTFSAQSTVSTVAGGQQTIPLGPVASQEAIKELGTNGGGFFNANSAHPFENPNALTNFVELLTVLLIPFALAYTFGAMARDPRQGWALFAAMMLLWLATLGVMYGAERAGNPNLVRAGANATASATQDGGNTEGKEVRFGIMGSTLFDNATTGTSCGAVNSMLDSYTPLGGGAALFSIMLAEVSPGGTGAGLFSLLLFVILAVFIAGLMVGRTPEYLGKKIQSKEIKLAMLGILAMNVGILVMSAVAVVVPAGLAGRLNLGPHGLSEIIYAFTSAVGNNGSAFAGLSGNTVFYNSLGGITMLIGRFLIILPALGIAGSLAAKNKVPVSAGTFPTTGPLFIGLLIGVILIIAGLTFFPVLALGPVVEHFIMHAGQLF